MIMKKLLRFIPLACVVCLFTGCAAVTRPVTDVALGAGGAALGGELSHNNPMAIVGGAAGGALLGEGLHYANSTTSLIRPAMTKAAAMPSNNNTGFTSPCSRPRRVKKAGSGFTKFICPN